MPRVTITLPADLHADVKAEAARTGRTMSEVIAEALREGLQRRKAEREADAVRMPTYGGTGLMPGVDLDSNAALREYLDGIGEKCWPSSR